jgi:hypothetical protein
VKIKNRQYSPSAVFFSVVPGEQEIGNAPGLAGIAAGDGE